MAVEIGRERYEVVEGFFQRPKRLTFVDVADVSVDGDDNVFVLCRGRYPVMIFDRDGRFLDAWGGFGDQAFTFPHGLSVGVDGHVYTADSRQHTVRRWTPDGRLVLTLGRAHQNEPAFSGMPFNRPTHATVARNGDIYVSDGHTNDGYGNSRMHVFGPDGTYKFGWGARGSGPGEFETVHGVFIDPADDTVYVADRVNHRIQRFQLDGTYLGEWGGLRQPQSIRKGPDGAFYVAELSHRVTVLDGEGRMVARWGDGVPTDGTPADKVIHEPGPGLFAAPHGIAVDSQGSFYVADASESYANLDRGSRALQKFVRV